MYKTDTQYANMINRRVEIKHIIVQIMKSML